MTATSTKLEIVGRSSSHFTRVTRIFAAELGLEYSFRPVPDLTSAEAADYGGNPALRVPILQTREGAWFGALNICRELARQADVKPVIVWPEALHWPLLANAQELTVQAMSTEVSLIMVGAAGQSDVQGHPAKMRTSLLNTLSWLEANAKIALAQLPSSRDLSFLEVTLFCLVTHLEFRKVVPIESYSALNDFCRQFAKRPSAEVTAFRFDT